ncbi:hypothetical protein Mal48_24560 [Thalassoglobus polymorphus]|uniref:Uncharacterized protein n=2 Tax=Thalassoglobus polymorphus TaxID=2527994 RepID=A0A517QNJ4_9PLAN|nr:hypothetical protein Mal48_24560 [Thalassoglobus polymorphus]
MIIGTAILTFGSLIIVLLLMALDVIAVQQPIIIVLHRLGLFALSQSGIGMILGGIAGIASSFTGPNFGVTRCFAVIFFVATFGATSLYPLHGKFGASGEFFAVFIILAILSACGIVYLNFDKDNDLKNR